MDEVRGQYMVFDKALVSKIKFWTVVVTEASFKCLFKDGKGSCNDYLSNSRFVKCEKPSGKRA